MTRFFTTAAAATIALAMSAATGAAQESTTFDIDTDEEGRASFESFTSSFDEWGTYDAWDADRDGVLSREEFNAGVWSYYDSDADDFLSADELSSMGNDRFFYDRGDDQAQDEPQTNN